MSTYAEEIAFNRGQYLEAVIMILDGAAFSREQRLGAIETLIVKYKESEYYEEETEDGE